MDLKLKIMEWNIHCAGCFNNFEVSNFVPDTIALYNADIVILLEFCFNNNWNYFIQSLKEKYDVYVSPFASGYNQVFIAVDKKKFFVNDIVSFNPVDSGLPELLHLKIDVLNNKCKTSLSVIGVRMKRQVDDKDKINERFFLKDYLSKINFSNILCMGDFNGDNNFVKKKISPSELLNVITPEHNESFWYTDKFIENYSYLFSNNNKKVTGRELDHIITNCKIENLKYSWDFINRDNVYSQFKKSISDGKGVLKIPNAYPDHAILLADIIL